MQSKFDSELKIWSGPSIPYPYPKDFMLGELIYKRLSEQQNPQKVIQINEADGSEMTCEDLRINSIRIVQNFRKIGIKEDDVVCIFLKQTNFVTYIINACIFMGAIINPLELSFRSDDIKHIMKKTNPKIVICDEEGISRIQGLLEEVGSDARIYSSSNSEIYPSALDFLYATNDETNFVLPKFAKSSDEKLMAILCSSGTTGRPKGVCISHMAVLLWPSPPAVTETVSLAYSLVYWASGFFRNVRTGMDSSDLCIMTDKNFDVDNFIDICEKYQVTNVQIPPRILAVLLNSKKFCSSVPKSLKIFFIAGAILSQNLRKKFDVVCPDKILLIAYGSTEASGVFTKPGEYKKGLAVGSLILPNCWIKIVDDDGNNLDKKKEGEIFIKQTCKFLGYFGDPEATAATLDSDGFVKTGDVGYFDEDGMLYVIDRKKDIVKVKGRQINPSFVEELIETLEGVQHVAVVGIPDDVCTTLLTAAIVRVKGYEASITEKDVMELVENNLPPYMHLLGGVYFFEELPMTLSNKIAKRLVLEEVMRLRK